MFDKLRQAHLHAPDWQQGSLTFVPLRGTWFAQSEHSFDLEEEITKFLSNDKKVLLLLGDSGSGKSLYTQGLASKLWKDYKETDSPIPVWISLPSLKNPVNRAIEETFEKFGFNAEQIISLKQEKSFIFILDAFDEIHQLKNLWVSNHLDQWKAKIIITCRREYLYHVDNYKHFFTPFNGEKALYLEYDEMIIKPFSEEQIEQYIKRYIQHQKPEWSLEQYQKVIEEMPGLKNLIKTPFLLKLAMDALPKMPKDKEKKYMTQAKLYDVFIEQWFIRQEQKLKLAKKIREDEDIKPEFWDYAKRLAQLMHQQKVTQVTYDSSQSSDLFFDAEENPWQKFFNPENSKIELLRTACLVREVGQHQYAFIHNSLLEYFLTRNLYENLLSKIQEVEVVKEVPKSPQLEVKKPQDYFNERLLVEESNTLQFLADRVDEDEGFKKVLFDRVYASIEKPEASIQASNALTILSYAQVSFSGMDFTGIQAPNADLSGAIFAGSSLRRADLKMANFAGVYLGNADLAESKLEDVHFGEYPAFKGPGMNCFCYSKDGKNMAVGGDGIIVYIKKGNNFEKLTELSDGKKYKGVGSMAFSPDGRILVFYIARDWEQTLKLWDLVTNKLVEMKGHSAGITSVAFSFDGKLLASGSRDKTVRVWDVITQQPLFELKGHTDSVRSVAFSPEGNLLASGSEDKAVRLWDPMNQKPLAELKGHNNKILDIAFSPDGKLLASGSTDYTVRLWDPIRQVALGELKGHFGNIFHVVFNPDGKLLASGSVDCTVRLWDPIKLVPLAELKGHEDNILGLAFNPDGKMLASGSTKAEVGVIRHWDIATLILKNEVDSNGHSAGITSLAFSPDGKLLASGSLDKTVRLWDPLRQKLLAELKGHTGWVRSLAFSPDGKVLASGGDDESVRLWDILTKKPLAEFREREDQVRSVAFSPDGKILASGWSKSVILCWNPMTQEFLGKLWARSSDLTLSFSPDGKLLASGGWDKTVRVWDTNSWKLLIELKGHTSVRAVAFSPDGKLLASVDNAINDEDKSICLWDTVTQKLVTQLRGGNSNCIAFSPDGKLLASGAGENEVWLWDPIKHEPLVVLKGHTGEVSSIAFSSDGKYLASGGSDFSILLWYKMYDSSLQEEKWILIYRFENSHVLFAESACLKGTRISSTSLTLLKQRGANADQAQIIDISDDQEQVIKTTNKEIALKDKPISTAGTTLSFWSPPREQVSASPPTPTPTSTKDTESTSFTF